MLLKGTLKGYLGLALLVVVVVLAAPIVLKLFSYAITALVILLVWLAYKVSYRKGTGWMGFKRRPQRD